MNKRIKKLAMECGAWTQVYENIKGNNDRHFMINEYFNVEKFAELIVNECVDFLYPKLNEKYTPEELLQQAKYRKLIREHFGVKNEI